MKIFVSLSVRTSPLKEQQTILANAKDDLAKATRNQTAAREKLNNATKMELNVPAARKNYQRATNSRKLKQDTLRVQQQKVQRAAVVDRLVQEWNRLDKLKGTEQDNDQAKKRRAELSKLITEARRALRAIKVKKIVGKVPKVN